MASISNTFGDPDEQISAEAKFYRIRQTGAASEYLVQIATLKPLLQWNDAALITATRKRIRDDIQDALAQMLTTPDTFKGFVQVAVQLDNRL